LRRLLFRGSKEIACSDFYPVGGIAFLVICVSARQLPNLFSTLRAPSNNKGGISTVAGIGTAAWCHIVCLFCGF